MLNETVSMFTSAANITTTYISTELYPRGVAIVDAPFRIPTMLWMLIPILATIILMEFYFGRYKEEELGWNTAFGNALVLTFVSIDLFRHTYEPIGITIKEALISGNTKIVISIVLFGLAILLVLLDFLHFLPKKFAYLINSSSFIHMIAVLGIIVVYSNNIPLDWTTLLACTLIFILANFILHIVYWIIPEYRSPLQRIINIDNKDNSK